MESLSSMMCFQLHSPLRSHPPNQVLQDAHFQIQTPAIAARPCFLASFQNLCPAFSRHAAASLACPSRCLALLKIKQRKCGRTNSYGSRRLWWHAVTRAWTPYRGP